MKERTLQNFKAAENITIDGLLIYEMSPITEYIGIGWLQNIIARYTVWKVERKFNRLQKRLAMVKLLEINFTNNNK